MDNSPLDLQSMLDVACDFPSALGAFAELRRYVRAVNEFLPHSSAQQTVRIKARLRNEDDPVRTGELEHELDVIALDSATTLPRVVWGGVLVSIYAAYENGIRNAIRHWQETTKHPEVFQQLPRKDFLRSAGIYSVQHIGLKLFSNASTRETLFDLKSLRNSFAHGSGLLNDLPSLLTSKVKSRANLGVNLDIVEGQWVANARCAAYYLLSSEAAIGDYGHMVLGELYEYHRCSSKEA